MIQVVCMMDWTMSLWFRCFMTASIIHIDYMLSKLTNAPLITLFIWISC